MAISRVRPVMSVQLPGVRIKLMSKALKIQRDTTIKLLDNTIDKLDYRGKIIDVYV